MALESDGQRTRKSTNQLSGFLYHLNPQIETVPDRPLNPTMICEQDSVSPTAAEDATSPTWSWSQPPSPVDTFGKATSTSPKPNPMPNPQAASRTKLATLRPSSVTKPRQGTTSLRLAGRKPRKPSATSKPAKRANAVKPASETRHDGNEKVAASDKIRARRNHNIVEKQYRNRLNAQFERLLSVLPPEQQKAPALANGQTSPSTRKRRASSSSVTVSTPEDRRLSKAEVLDVATNRIKELEADRERLLREKSDLILGIKVVGGVVAKSGVRGSAQVGS
ncbi:hypothetical protein QBC34DRAFT_65807 [Podospora aff. communis PSN243]|uniref:BHLH domain-containing protein n=1 Tax=Podospora aff. communis PSN243 TaxID=3040156 RepID=A0AAV9GQY5_9PEZI|nr:hypothetical protein QBC34DRAFT_65807 [Podospora aff. communis PSN243]